MFEPVYDCTQLENPESSCYYKETKHLAENSVGSGSPLTVSEKVVCVGGKEEEFIPVLCDKGTNGTKILSKWVHIRATLYGLCIWIVCFAWLVTIRVQGEGASSVGGPWWQYLHSIVGLLITLGASYTFAESAKLFVSTMLTEGVKLKDLDTGLGLSSVPRLLVNSIRSWRESKSKASLLLAAFVSVCAILAILVPIMYNQLPQDGTSAKIGWTGSQYTTDNPALVANRVFRDFTSADLISFSLRLGANGMNLHGTSVQGLRTGLPTINVTYVDAYDKTNKNPYRNFADKIRIIVGFMKCEKSGDLIGDHPPCTVALGCSNTLGPARIEVGKDPVQSQISQHVVLPLYRSYNDTVVAEASVSCYAYSNMVEYSGGIVVTGTEPYFTRSMSNNWSDNLHINETSELYLKFASAPRDPKQHCGNSTVCESSVIVVRQKLGRCIYLSDPTACIETAVWEHMVRTMFIAIEKEGSDGLLPKHLFSGESSAVSFGIPGGYDVDWRIWIIMVIWLFCIIGIGLLNVQMYPTASVLAMQLDNMMQIVLLARNARFTERFKDGFCGVRNTQGMPIEIKDKWVWFGARNNHIGLRDVSTHNISLYERYYGNPGSFV